MSVESRLLKRYQDELQWVGECGITKSKYRERYGDSADAIFKADWDTLELYRERYLDHIGRSKYIK